MKHRKILMAAGLLLSLTSINAEAWLIAFPGDEKNLVYSSVSNVIWTQDANLFKTLSTTNANLVSQIVSVTPTYNDPVYGLRTIDAEDFIFGDGRMSWWGAKAFVNYLNSINYAASNQWRLPTSNAIEGYNGTAGNELGQLFYGELGGTAGNSIPNTSTFNNEQASWYWSGTEYAANPGDAWFFGTYDGSQGHLRKYDNEPRPPQLFAWVVSPNQVAAVPVPGAVWLFGSGVIGFMGASLKRKLL